jgi:hypothetical protein
MPSLLDIHPQMTITKLRNPVASSGVFEVAAAGAGRHRPYLEAGAAAINALTLVMLSSVVGRSFNTMFPLGIFLIKKI